MDKKNSWLKVLLMVLSYILVAAVACSTTIYYMYKQPSDKLSYLQLLVDTYYIGEVDQAALEDGMANGLVEALPDRWSYYIPKDSVRANQENLDNAYIGIGVTITVRQDGTGFDVDRIEPGSGADDAGIRPGDVVVGVEEFRVSDHTVSEITDIIRGEDGTVVNIVILRDGQELTIPVTRETIKTKVATGQLLNGEVGYITIKNFNSRCAQETIEQIRQLQEEGATAFIFDIRFNPGGYKSELVKLLDYLLPEGDLFRSQLYNGQETVDTSDSGCLEVPMAVLINGNSYSAAEFFAAALREYEWATLVGEKTVGKGYFQSTFNLPDGSAVALSIGKYFTPKGVCLEEIGGLTPDVEVSVDSKTAAMIYSGQLDPMEDIQVLAALEALKK